MKNPVVPNKYIFQLVFIASIILASYLGCAPTSKSKPFQTTAITNPHRTRTFEFTTTQDQTSQRPLGLTTQPSSRFSQQFSKTAALPRVVVPPSSPFQTLVPSDVIIREMMGQINIDRALIDLRRLTGEEPVCIDNECYTIQNRLTGSEGLQRAKDYVHGELVSLGYTVEIRDWSRSGWADQNLIARKSGTVTPGDEIYFVAHLDGVKLAGADRFPAADDDGSGVVNLLELARVLSRYTFGRTVVLFFSTGEEEGALGVRAYLDQLSSEELSAIQYVVSMDMVGYDANHDGVMELWSGNHQPSLVFTQMLSEIINTYHLDLVPRLVSGCT